MTDIEINEEIDQFLSQKKDFLIEEYGLEQYEKASKIYKDIHLYRRRYGLEIIPFNERNPDWMDSKIAV